MEILLERRIYIKKRTTLLLNKRLLGSVPTQLQEATEIRPARPNHHFFLLLMSLSFPHFLFLLLHQSFRFPLCEMN